ncbi:MAG: tryptophan tryptophylquinone biosynthesis enzyme MauG [gamma proteobacterium symbiont of Taylorina sp.]|nr:tryptophan tryptophylquinone biosynthesis enzyme MauG [gamma proteobacterium symbiont of Taylorina sp.]
MSSVLVLALLGISQIAGADDEIQMIFKAGDLSLQKWLLADKPPVPKHNYPSHERIELGKKLFFDPRISRDGNMSCATCHSPMFGWGDGLPLGVGYKGKILGRASPVVTNTAYNSIQMWDGRKRDLEDQATGPMEASVEMNTDMHAITKLFSNSGYKKLFDKAYPGEKVGPATAAKAIASFEWTILSNDSPFDNWVRGDETAMTKQQINGFKLFVDSDKGNCSVCHSAPNFTDNGFHNVGLKAYGEKNPDMGRYVQKPIRVLKGAFKTPTLRDITLSAPYFHNGEASTLMQVMDHYNKGGVTKKDLSPNIKEIKLDKQESEDIVAFMQALTTPPVPFDLPILPLD